MPKRNEISCSCGDSDLILDFEESKKESDATGIFLSVYSCQSCGKLYVLKLIGEKPIGWKTKKFLNNKKEIDSIPF